MYKMVNIYTYTIIYIPEKICYYSVGIPYKMKVRLCKMSRHVTACSETIQDLTLEGWQFDHWAMYKGYRGAGTVSAMSTRNGVQYCRVHDSLCKYKYLNGYRVQFQLTAVMKRKEY